MGEPLIKFISFIKFIDFNKTLILIKFFMALSRGWALKSPIVINLSYALQKKSIVLVNDCRNRESESKGGLYIDITTHFSFLRLNSKVKACILNWN